MFQLIASVLAVGAVLSTVQGAYGTAVIASVATVLWVLLARPRRRKTPIPFASRDRPPVPIIR